jgi:hypothetical protein
MLKCSTWNKSKISVAEEKMKVKLLPYLDDANWMDNTNFLSWNPPT